MYKLEFLERPNYIHARISATEIDISMAMEYLSEVMLYCADKRKKRLLIERDIPSMMPQDEMDQAMNYLVSIDSKTRIAFLNPHAKVERSLKNIIDHGTDRGGNYRYFKNLKEAEIWLLKK